MSSKVKYHEANWKIIYDLLYVFHINFGHNMHHFWDISANRSQRPIFDLPDLEIDLLIEWLHTIYILGQYWHHSNEATWHNKIGQHFGTTE